MKNLVDFRNPGETNWTLAFDRAVDAATPLGESIRFPPGLLFFLTKPKTMGCGITLEGDSAITSAKLGTCCFAYYQEDNPEEGFFTWDGSDPRGYKGTGGGIRNMSLYRWGGMSGGTAIKVLSLNSIEQRAGWWSLSNVAVLAEQTSTWDRVLLADGSRVSNPGSEGMRVILLRDMMCSSAKVRTVEFRNVVHCSWSGGQVQGGPTVEVPDINSPVGILITGKHSQDIHINGVSVYGTLRIEQCEQFTFNGMCKWVYLNGRAAGKAEAGRVKRGIVNAVGCDMFVDMTDNLIDKVRVTTL